MVVGNMVEKVVGKFIDKAVGMDIGMNVDFHIFVLYNLVDKVGLEVAEVAKPAMA